MEVPVDGRLYVRNLPLSMEYWEVAGWVTERCGMRPTFVKLLKPGFDMRSAYVHMKATPGQLADAAWYLTGDLLTHKRTTAEVSNDDRPVAPGLKQ